ncbi:MAG: glucose-1-phosphate adenylyltransferase, partial [Spirochaetales bacterium]|nr:glucose-1-phosphate adenylyltransferase [Spirochaetales bacterium]
MASNQVLAMVLAGGKGERLYPLTEDRSKPAVPFGGNFKLIDFTLSNCIHSGFKNIKILTQYKSESLDNHISIWKKIHNRMGTCRDINTIKSTGIHMYRGTADAIRQNIRTIEENKPDYVLILSSDHVYSMDYS